jgi:hypothetical protein
LDPDGVRLPGPPPAERAGRVPRLRRASRAPRRLRRGPRRPAPRRHRQLPVPGQPAPALRPAAPLPRRAARLRRCDLQRQPHLRPGDVGGRLAGGGAPGRVGRRRPRPGPAVLPGSRETGRRGLAAHDRCRPVPAPGRGPTAAAGAGPQRLCRTGPARRRTRSGGRQAVSADRFPPGPAHAAVPALRGATRRAPQPRPAAAAAYFWSALASSATLVARLEGSSS